MGEIRALELLLSLARPVPMVFMYTIDSIGDVDGLRSRLQATLSHPAVGGTLCPARSLKSGAARYETLTDLLGNCRGREVKPEVEAA